MNIWTLPLVVGLIIAGFGAVLLAWQVVNRAAAETTHVEVFGLKAGSPYVSVVLVLVGLALFWLGVTNTAAQSALQIADVSVSVDGRTGPQALTWETACPATVQIAGLIAGSGDGAVTYQFIRQVGLSGPEEPTTPRTVQLVNDQTVAVADEVTVPFPIGTYYYSDVLRVITPSELRSDPVGFTVTCNPTTPTLPPGIPPPPSIGPIAPPP